MSGGGSPSHVTQTTQTQLPSWLSSANQYGAGQAKSLYNTGGPQYYPGETVAPLSSIQENYLTNANALGSQGNPSLNAANQYTQNVMGGKYLDPSSNPYLANTFNQAANQVQNHVSSEFAGSGRNIEASVPVQNEQMNNLATNIYGGAYNNERQLQNQSAYMQPALNQANLANLGATAQAGTLEQNQAQNYINADQNRFNYGQTQPYQNLQNYMGTVNSLNGGQTQVSQSPIYQNKTAGALGGALAGSQVGSAYAQQNPNNPYASLIGAGIGALAGYVL